VVRFAHRLSGSRRITGATIATLIMRNWWILVALWLLFSLWVGWSIRP